MHPADLPAARPGLVHPADLPAARAAADPGGACLADLDRSVSAGEFAAWVDRVAGVLAGRGVGRGAVIGTMMANRLELVVGLFAAWRLGAAVTPLNPGLTAGEAAYQLADSGAVLCLVDGETAARVDGARVDGARAGGVPILDVDEVTAARASLGGPPPPPRVPGRRADTALLIYTSGTTGRPKGVVLDHGNVAAMTGMLVAAFGLTAPDRVLLVLPLYHVNGVMASVMASLAAGGSCVVVPRFDRAAFWGQVERFRPTYFSAVPTMYILLNELPPSVRPDVASLRFAVCGAAPMPPEAIAAFERRYGVPVVEGYGLSEGTVASTLNPVHGPRKTGTVGVALPGQEVAVVDPDGRPVPPGERGEVVIRGPNVMRGYLGRPEETAATVRDGWLHTGDVGWLDADGYLTLVDRMKEVIIRGGENLYPKEIETVLYRHPAVVEAAVVGRPDPVFGEQPVAFVSLRAPVDPEALRDHCRTALAPAKVPREVHVLDDLPKNSVGKLVKAPLRARAAQPAQPA